MFTALKTGSTLPAIQMGLVDSPVHSAVPVLPSQDHSSYITYSISSCKSYETPQCNYVCELIHVHVQMIKDN